MDHLRYGSLELPNAVSEKAVRRELDYYGIIADENTVKKSSFSKLMKAYALEQARIQSEINSLESDLKEQKLINSLLALASECNTRFCLADAETETFVFTMESSFYTQIGDMSIDELTATMLNEFLANHFGLTVKIDRKENYKGGYYNSITVAMKE